MKYDLKKICRFILTTDYSDRQIALIAGCSHSTVGAYRARLRERGQTWQTVAELGDERILGLLRKSAASRSGNFIEPDWLIVERELRKKGVDRYMLWCEYQAATPKGQAMRYRTFCRGLARFKKGFGLVMRQEHLGGEKLFIDFMGGRPYWSDPETGQKHYVEVFVACLGASNYTYAEACESQKTRDWIEAHVNALEFFRGVPEVFVPDNLKAAVLARPRREDPVLNPAYAALADYYDSVIIPAGARRPRDKAKVELAVKLVHRALTAVLRKRTFFSLSELNAALREIVRELNDRPFKKIPEHSRRSLFGLLDRPALKPLPRAPYQYQEFKVGVRVGADYHVAYEGAFYSVPAANAGAKVDVRASGRGVEIWRNGERIAIHPRMTAGARSTNAEHMTAAHRAWHDSEQDLVSWAESYGPHARFVVEHHSNADRPLNGRRSTLRSLRRLAKSVGPERFEAACGKAREISGLEVRTIENILKRRLESSPAATAAKAVPPRVHANIRGPGYYS